MDKNGERLHAEAFIVTSKWIVISRDAMPPRPNLNMIDVSRGINAAHAGGLLLQVSKLNRFWVKLDIHGLWALDVNALLSKRVFCRQKVP